MIVNVAYTLVLNTVLFPDACRAWQSRAIAAKTWAQFKIDFATAHREFRLTNQTAQQSGFHSANMMIEQGRDDSMQETAEAISQLATASASDRGTVATLTTTNAKLANQLDKLLPLPQPPVRARTDAQTNPSAHRATQLRSVLARVYAVSIQNQITNTVP
jgi:hypothetical protein